MSAPPLDLDLGELDLTRSNWSPTNSHGRRSSARFRPIAYFLVL